MPPIQQTEQQRQNAINASGQQPAPQQPVQQPTPPSTTPAQPTFSQGDHAVIPTTTPIQTPTPATAVKPATAPTLPQPQAPTVQQGYFNSVAADAANAKASLQSAYDTQSTQIQSQLDTLKQQQADALAQEKALSAPFQAQYEQTQQQLLHVTDNFNANQNLANELNSLVTEANSRLSGVATDFTSKSYGAAVYNKTLSDLTARAGLIQSAMAAYSGQIGQAYTMIDRSVAAINADRTDQMSYYQTILSLNNQSQLDLSSQAKTLAQQKLDQLKSEADSTQQTADAIKQAMLDPSTAQAYAQAGVTLTDTPDQINKKLGDYAYSQELSQTNNSMAAKGYTSLLPGQSAPSGAQVVTTTDSKGNEKQYYQLPTSASSSSALSALLGTPAGDPSTASAVSGNASPTDILSSTGLSLPAFNFLTQGTAALSRMTSADRVAVMSEASQWAKANHVDVSTFQSQYKAYNDVLQQNIERANNTSIYANEVAGSADALASVIDQKDLQPGFLNSLLGITAFKPTNLVALATGSTVNDPLTLKYATQLQAMTNDYAGYLAASRGAKTPELADIQDAARVISSGLNTGSVQAFKEAIQANEQKVAGVVNGAVEKTRQQVWSLFGVGNQYQTRTDTQSPASSSGNNPLGI